MDGEAMLGTDHQKCRAKTMISASTILVFELLSALMSSVKSHRQKAEHLMEAQSEKHSEDKGHGATPAMQSTTSMLNDRKEEIKERLKWALRWQLLLALAAFVAFPASIIIYVRQTDYNYNDMVVIIAVAHWMIILILFIFITHQRLLFLSRMSDLNFEIELAGYHLEERQLRAERMFRRNEQELLKYYSVNLTQNHVALLSGIACIAAGIGISVFTIYIILGFTGQVTSAGPNVTQVSDFEIWTKGIAAGVGAISTIMVNVVAAIYLQMHSRASDALGQFHQRLVHTNQLFLANMIASRVSNDEQRLSLLTDMAKQITQDAVERAG